MRWWTVLAGVGTLLAVAGAQIQMAPVRESEPNDSFGAPQVIGTSLNSQRGCVVWNAQITPQGDRDFYQITISQQGVYSLRVDSNRDPVMTLYNASGEILGSAASGGNPNVPNGNAPGLTLTLSAGTYIVEVAYRFNIGLCRYALRVFPGTQAPDTDPTEPNNSFDEAFGLGSFTGGELISPTFGFLSYGGGDMDIYRFKVSGSASYLRIRTETYVDTVIEVHTSTGEIFSNDDSDWDTLNGGASEVVIPNASAGAYFVVVRGFGTWGGYYRLRVLAELPTEVVLIDGETTFRLRDLQGSPFRSLLNNTDWLVAGRDHLYQLGWWFRREGTNTQEQALASLYSFEQEAASRATLIYNEGGLITATTYSLRGEGAERATLRIDALVLNFNFEPQRVHLFHYFDPDIGQNHTNTATSAGERLRFEAPNNDFCYLTPLNPPTFWEVQGWSATLDRLLDGEPTQLVNGSLPFTGDVAGAFQWVLLLEPFTWRRITLHYAVNTETLAFLADVNQDGCVDDADLLEVLFAFGNTTFAPVDVNGDGIVDDADLLEVLFAFGRGCG
ncbi:pre-peptidase C-terminal domain-containing protein [Armatimonadetes bacterium GXS]|nr:pre-peptidase C-terminal domain-containing protein [Armatimonadetes bacterium GXS]